MAWPTVTNTFVKSSLVASDKWNVNFSNLISALTDGTKDIKVAGAVINENLTISGAINTLTDTSTSTVNGWDHFVYTQDKQIYYRKWGNTCSVYYYLTGPGDQTSSCRIALPFQAASSLLTVATVFNTENGVNFVGRCYLENGNFQVGIYKSILTVQISGPLYVPVWISGSTRTCWGIFKYQTT